MTEEVVIEGAQPEIQVVKEKVLVWGVGVGSKGTVRVSWPDTDYFVEARPPRGNHERLEIQMSGVIGTPGGEMSVSAWAQFLVQAEVQIVDFCFPQYDRETEEFTGKVCYKKDNGGRNPENIQAYKDLDTKTFNLVMTILNTLAGEGGGEVQEAFDRLKNEQGLLVQPIQK